MPSVLITGASKGIGHATASEFARRRYRVIATARDPRSLADLPVAQRLALDVTDQDSVNAAVAAAGPVDVLVSNAGVLFHAAFEATPLSAMRQLFEQNFVGAVRVAQAVLPQMRERGAGRMLFVSSVAGRIALPAGTAYSASKWALEAAAETLSIETAPFGITVGVLEPGPVDSGALDDVTRYVLEGDTDPYADLLDNRTEDMTADSPEFVASAIADAAERADLPLRIPVGASAGAMLADRRRAPDDVPFRPGGST